VAAILSLGLFYAFTCSATCANCFAVGAAALTPSQGCEHEQGSVPRGAQQKAPAKPDCSGHHRFGFDVLASDGLSRLPLSATGHAAELFYGAAGREVAHVAASFFSDLAPPRAVTILPQQNNSILRI